VRKYSSKDSTAHKKRSYKAGNDLHLISQKKTNGKKCTVSYFQTMIIVRCLRRVSFRFHALEEIVRLNRCIDYEPHGSIEFAQYEEYFRRELPQRVRHRLEVLVDQELGPVEERLKSRLVDIVRTCQEELFSSYQQSLAENLNDDDLATATTSIATHSHAVIQGGPGSSTHPASDNLFPAVFAPPTAPDELPTMDAMSITNITLAGNEPNSDLGYGSSDWRLLSATEPTSDQDQAFATWEPFVEKDGPQEETPAYPPLDPTQSTSNKGLMQRFPEDDVCDWHFMAKGRG
jgi:hypothetical protein